MHDAIGNDNIYARFLYMKRNIGNDSMVMIFIIICISDYYY